MATAAASSPGQQPHAVVVPYPAQSHLNPIMQLAKFLASRGVFVTFVITAEFHSRVVQAHSLSPTPSSDASPNLRIAQISDGLPPDFDRFGGGPVQLCSAVDEMAGPFEELIRELQVAHPPVSCIFSDMSTLFTQDVANKFRIPRVAIWLQSAASYSVSLHVPLLIREGHIPVKANPKLRPPTEDSIDCIPAHPPFGPTELPSYYQAEDLSDFLAQFKLKPFVRIKEAACVLINTFYELESSILDALKQDHPVFAAGPFLPPAFVGIEGSEDTRTGMALWPEDNECLPWLDRQPARSVLYVSFGSIVSMTSTQFTELAMGLEASQARVMWVIRPDFVESMASLLPSCFSEKTKAERVYVTSWAPQALVLSHASVGGFLTHCGWNSILEGLSFGVPMLCWPLFADQWLNRKWVVEQWKVGMKFNEGEEGLVKREEVERVVRELMEGPQGNLMRERGVLLRDERRKAFEKGGSSLSQLSMILHSLHNTPLHIENGGMG